MVAVFVAHIDTPIRDGFPDMQHFAASSLIDGRRILNEEYAKGRKPYIGCCYTRGVVLCDNIKDYVVSSIATKEKRYERPAKALRVAKDNDTQDLGAPCKLSTSIPLMEMIAASCCVCFTVVEPNTTYKTNGHTL
jgi:hypothetical protein